MAFSGIDSVVTSITGGKQLPMVFNRTIDTGATSAAGRWHSLLTTGGTGGAMTLTGSAGTGVALMQRLMDLAAERGFTEVYLHAQVTAAGFYERLGFRADGPEFDEVGIPHQCMRRAVGKRDGTSAGPDGNAQHPLEP